ncbi:MAG: flippase [Candidatus Veblenbacteria bacterium]|nr:flippase [Candidatus Veblenbacteria bacterium]MDZ4230135.1 flippase [Candidatus Veblenbacteria bacterium]
MSAEPAVLARNTSYFTLALVAQKVISFLYFTFLARLLGPEAIGKYIFALSLTTVFSVLLDLGLANVLTREVARQPEFAPRYARVVIGFKLLAMAAVAGGAVLYVWLAGYPELTRQLVYLACLVMVLDSFTLTAYSTIRGFHTLTWESIGTVLMQAVLALAGVVVSSFTHDLRWFMAALVLAALTNCIYSLWQLKHRYQLRLAPRLGKADLVVLARLTWPFALAALLTRLYGYLDTMLLSLLSGDRAVGLYSVAYKITFALQFIPAAFSASLFPGFSAYFQSAPAKLAATFTRGVVYLTAIAVPISFGIVALAPKAIAAIYPAYTEAVLPLQVLIFSLIFLFITFPVGALLPACNRQLRQTGNLALAAGVNIGLNFLLIPRFGPLGAAWASFVSTLVLLVAGWVVAARLVPLDNRFLRRRLGRIMFSGLVMLACAWWLRGVIHFAAVIPLAGAVYVVLVVGLGGVTWTELKDLASIITRRPRATV